MKNFIIFLIIFIIIAFAGFMLIRYKNNSNNNSSNYSGVKISAEQNTQENKLTLITCEKDAKEYRRCVQAVQKEV